jgi:hypothetical protein
MTVVNMPKRPTVANPVIKNQAVANALSALDDHVRLLGCAADSAALRDPNKQTVGELTETLYFLHVKLRTETDKLFSLL